MTMRNKPTILIVDDMVDYLRSLAGALRGRFNVEMADTVDQAKACSASLAGELRIAIVDICLDETNTQDRSGLELIRWLRCAYPALSVIGMSAVPDEALPREAELAGATQFLRKPISVAKLMETLQALVKGLTNDAAANPDS